MGTPSYIAKQIGADSYLTIYCQIEGHLHSTGYLLDKHYNTPEQVDALLALGDIYSVESTLNPDNHNYGKTGRPASVMDIDTLLDDEDFADYLYIIDLCTKLDGLGFLASDDGTYIMTVNADDAVTDFPPFKHFLFLYKDLSDGGKTLMVILGISE